MSLYGFEYPPPVPRTGPGRRQMGLNLPGSLADKGQHGDLVVAEAKGIGHGMQLRWIGNAAGLDRGPLRGLHAAQPGGFFQGTAARFTGLLDAVAKKPAP